jgi:hypothetical protein
MPICNNCKKVRDDEGYIGSRLKFMFEIILRRSSVTESALIALTKIISRLQIRNGKVGRTHPITG